MPTYPYGKRTQAEYSKEEAAIRKSNPKASNDYIKSEMNFRKSKDIEAHTKDMNKGRPGIADNASKRKGK